MLTLIISGYQNVDFGGWMKPQACDPHQKHASKNMAVFLAKELKQGLFSQSFRDLEIYQNG